MSYYTTRYVHKIHPSDKDVGPVIHLATSELANRKVLAKALRDMKILGSGERLNSFRVEGDKIVAFPMKSVWNAIVLLPYKVQIECATSEGLRWLRTVIADSNGTIGAIDDAGWVSPNDEHRFLEALRAANGKIVATYQGK